MRILLVLAQRIVSEVTQVINEEVIVVGPDGFIVAGSDNKRVGTFHEGALRVVKSKKKMPITEEDVERLQGVKSGLNLPITFQKEVIGVIGITGSLEKVSSYGELIQRMTELIIQEAHYSERLESKMRGLESFVYEWVHSTEQDDDFRERGEILGIRMDVPRKCALIQLDIANEPIDELLIEREVLERYGPTIVNSEDLLVRWGNGRFVLLKVATTQQKESLFREKLEKFREMIRNNYGISSTIGVGSLQKGIEYLSKSYQEAKRALRTSRKGSGITFYDELTLDIALAEISDETREEVVKKVLGPILYEQELMETLEQYFIHHTSLKHTASALHIHINTLHYRLKRIGELTGESLKDTRILVTCYIALNFWNEIR
ncbi:CdaR family transcriptional regulator [Bacillus sp. FJAT-45350]|uniref:CdaR family transcriptional regulator n=1 Tax=Bacillus sp. FJAT-45350 TaxID=2011014 RepID=UPI000BB92FD7|nr:sugar diacid recognition domain-containing protein [Bacillus sp. FJAT-45350]